MQVFHGGILGNAFYVRSAFCIGIPMMHSAFDSFAMEDLYEEEGVNDDEMGPMTHRACSGDKCEGGEWKVDKVERGIINGPLDSMRKMKMKM